MAATPDLLDTLANLLSSDVTEGGFFAPFVGGVFDVVLVEAIV